MTDAFKDIAERLRQAAEKARSDGGPVIVATQATAGHAVILLNRCGDVQFMKSRFVGKLPPESTS